MTTVRDDNESNTDNVRSKKNEAGNSNGVTKTEGGVSENKASAAENCTESGNTFLVSDGSAKNMYELIPNMPNDEYHATDDISSSNIKTALKSMGKYKAQLDGDRVFKATPAMKLGTLVHALVLEPHTVDDQFAASEKFDGRTKEGKAGKLAFAEASKGKVVVTLDVMAKAQAMAIEVLLHPEVRDILNVNGIKFEHSGFCVDQETKLNVKYRPDIRTDHFIADLKTCADASKEEFAKSIMEFGYHTSSAHYLKCDREIFGTNHDQFIFICVENEFPYEVAVYTLSASAINQGYKNCANALQMIKTANETGNYPKLNDGLACEIDIPAWGYKV